MFKVVLTLAIFIAAVFAQAPTTPASCITYTNTTGTAFCAADILYTIPSTTNLVQKNTDAFTAFTNIINQIAGANDACRTAVRTFTCQTNFNRCARYASSPAIMGVAQTRCDTVRTACNVTAFPGTLASTGCVANVLASVDSPNVVCVPNAFTTLGGSCTGSIFNPTITTPSIIQNNICPSVSSCNTTSGVCARPSNLGDACIGTGASSCVTLAGSSTSLECLGNRCSYRNKRHGIACVVNEECRSNNCLNNTCFESAVNQNCSTTLNCRDNLWCDIRNGTCYSNALVGEQCGIVQANWSPVPCVFGSTCVRENATSGSGLSYCRLNANVGDLCSIPAGAITYDNALCDPSNLPTGVAQCTNGRCVLPTGGASEGQSCNSTMACLATLTCRYETNATQGTCSQPGTVACDTVGGNQCNVNQQCTCTANTAQSGTCALAAQNPSVNCAAQILAVGLCVKAQCRNAPFIPYDGISCGATQCSSAINAYFCCVKNTVGANYVAPAGQTTDPCAGITTTLSPGGTTVSPSGTPNPSGTNVPTPTPSRSGAVNIAVSFVAIIIAVVASL